MCIANTSRALHYTTFLLNNVYVVIMLPSSDCMLTVKEVAAYLRFNQRTVYRPPVECGSPGFMIGVLHDRWITTPSKVTFDADGSPACRKGNR